MPYMYMYTLHTFTSSYMNDLIKFDNRSFLFE